MQYICLKLAAQKYSLLYSL